MFKKLRQIHYMFYISLIFMVFPVVAVMTGDSPAWILLASLVFMLAYLAVLLLDSPKWVWFSWVLLLAYIYYSSVFLTVNYSYFLFYLSNILTYRFRIISWKNAFLWTFLGLQAGIFVSLLLLDAPLSILIFFLVISSFVDLLSFGLLRLRLLEELKNQQREQNSQINLLLAENERNRIGQDLHDSLGHTFAMMSVKTELALQFLQRKQYNGLEKELRDLHEISKQSMQEVRLIVENLKNPTIKNQLGTVERMLSLAGLEVKVENTLDQASYSPSMESTMAMVLLELATNTIKHAQASHVTITLFANQVGLSLQFQDDGRGFDRPSGKELHSIRDRIEPLGGEICLKSLKNPTRIDVQLPYKEE